MKTRKKAGPFFVPNAIREKLIDASSTLPEAIGSFTVMAGQSKARTSVFRTTYTFLLAAAALQSRSSDPHEAAVGKTLYDGLVEVRSDFHTRALKA